MGKGLGKSGSKWWVESCLLEIVNLITIWLAGGLIAVRVGHQLAIPAGEGNNLWFALLVVRANWNALEMSCFATVKTRPALDDFLNLRIGCVN